MMDIDDDFHVLVTGVGESAKASCILHEMKLSESRVDKSCRYHWSTYCPGLEEGRQITVLS